MSDDESTTAWVTVAEAAEKARIDSGTVRQWYRSGRIPTRRASSRTGGGTERGAFLVPLDLVLSLATPPAEAEGALGDLRDLNAGFWSAETEATKEELASARADLSGANEQLEFLRGQLAEMADENRSLRAQLQTAEDLRAGLRAELADAQDDRKGIESRLLTVEAELTQVRRSASRGSITDHSWLDEDTPAYQSPVRRQGMPTAPKPTPTPEPVPTASSVVGELADLLAATRADDEDTATVEARPVDDHGWLPDDDGDRDPYTASRAVWTDEAPRPAFGDNVDDLLPDQDKKGRFGKK
jgi:hypothetical protein